ncbi:glycerophosphodiester phosphodiesterase family protein [Amphibacillus jilinensis]|uniref:glycerophosphodiester phosphodiesterase family protein n=1 Tax=Amphibacillus jilinensis TaxID=1216008 RepID=UPI0002E0AABE|nr:glycerophosphodiester phosphodiesterase family protein [Amphibacillus jilinensis]
MITISLLIIAHRGASFDQPENSFSAFKLANQLGADGIETDVHLTKDNIPVLIHDETIDRVTSNNGYVHQYTYKDLKKLDIGSWFDPRYHGERILSLNELLEWMTTTNLLLNLELKTNKIAYEGIEKIVSQQIDQFNLSDRVIFSSFNKASLEMLKAINKNNKVALLTSHLNRPIMKELTELKANGLHLKYRHINRRIVKTLHDNHLYIAPYTVNHPNHLRRCFQLNCDMIITDRPDLAVKKRALYLQSLEAYK